MYPLLLLQNCHMLGVYSFCLVTGLTTFFNLFDIYSVSPQSNAIVSIGKTIDMRIHQQCQLISRQKPQLHVTCAQNHTWGSDTTFEVT